MVPQACGSDDRETPLLAVQHLTAVVSVLFDDDKSSIRVYDPYFCKGAIISLLGHCGFDEKKVFNKNCDCYVSQKNNTVPENDIIITNPPYSGITYCGI
jgi:hypothetical protein